MVGESRYPTHPVRGSGSPSRGSCAGIGNNGIASCTGSCAAQFTARSRKDPAARAV